MYQLKIIEEKLLRKVFIAHAASKEQITFKMKHNEEIVKK